MTTRGLQLPKAIRDQIENESGRTRGRKNSKRPQTSRKVERKQAREEKKQRKRVYFAHTEPSIPCTGKRVAEQELVNQPVTKRLRAKKDVPSPSAPFHNVGKTKQKISMSEEGVTSILDFDPSSLAEDPEDAEIARLEKLLGRNRRKKAKPMDDLDTLFNDLEGIGGSEAEEGNSAFGQSKETSEIEDTLEGHDTEGEFAEGWSGILTSASTSQARELHNSRQPVDAPTEFTATSQGRYVPPQARSDAQLKDDEKILKLRRQIKGLLNKLTEQNISSIMDEFEDLYRNNTRHDTTTVTANILTDLASLSSSLSDSFLILLAAVVSALCKVIGIEFGAHIINQLISAYDIHYRSLRGPHDPDRHAGKECYNLITFLSELYTFKVISCVLIYDIIRELLGGDLSEADVELLLKLVRSSGPQLRQDDPAALTGIVELVNEKLAAEQVQLNSRAKFMVEAMNELKNNKLKKNGVPTGVSGVLERLQRFTAGLDKKYHVRSHEPFRVTLTDLRQGETRGKWWLVGSAWAGDPLSEKREENTQLLKDNTQVPTTDKLIKLARIQGMNTDIRRTIFVVIMSSEDYVDACDRLSRLHLTEIQQREIVRVLFHCTGQEKNYNPYYTLIMQRLCSSSYSHRITLQYCIWDFLRGLGETSMSGSEVQKDVDVLPNFPPDKGSVARVASTARALAWLVAKDATSLMVFKPLNFAVLQARTKAFLRMFFEQLLISTQSTSPVVASTKTLQGKQWDSEVICNVTKASLKVSRLSQGLLYVVPILLNESRKSDEFFQWAVDLMRETLRSGGGMELE